MGWDQSVEAMYKLLLWTLLPLSQLPLYHSTAEAEVRLIPNQGSHELVRSSPVKPSDETSAWPTLRFHFVKTLKWDEPGISGSKRLDREKQEELRQRSWSDQLPSPALGTLYPQDAQGGSGLELGGVVSLTQRPVIASLHPTHRWPVKLSSNINLEF